MKKIIAMVLAVVMMVAFGATAMADYEYDNNKFNVFLAKLMIELMEETNGLDDIDIDVDYDEDVNMYVIEIEATEIESGETTEIVLLVNDKVTTCVLNATLTNEDGEIIDTEFVYGAIDDMLF